MIYTKHGPEVVIFFSKPLTFLLRRFQAYLNVVLIGGVFIGCHMIPSRAN